jgi:serine/threonine-protein kinase RsbW
MVKAMTEHIRLSFPVNAAYVSSARLTASSIANRIRFDIDEIEDIKTAVSEACTYIIKRSSSRQNSFEICFMPGEDEINVDIIAVGEWAEPQADEMSLMMISALVDEFSISKPQEDKISITMSKKHKESNLFD